MLLSTPGSENLDGRDLAEDRVINIAARPMQSTEDGAQRCNGDKSKFNERHGQ
jgi:hypothetical protein